MKGNKTTVTSTNKRNSGRPKGRSATTFANKCRRIEKWYKNMERTRQELNPNIQSKNGDKKLKKPLKPIEYFIDKVKRPNMGGEK